ncbi:phospholipase D-like domain-containing protein [Rufibacter tibetensis]|uniref:phospholipase D-like domain-containing protein n=1 Tax=Rufibacter tibetensis TaxID=512763 RepID=UPI0007856103|nr:phospholipase D-like domain-containing protein [Rufibacter tibetensis]
MTYLLNSVDWLLIWNIVYLTVLVLVCLRIIYDTGSTSKTLAYLLLAIYLAQEEVLITTPYFIPGEGILQALTVAALGGVKVKLLVPGISDSALVNAATWSYYDDMLLAGVEIYLYQKGFIHSKTMVIDGAVSMVGTANMDNRSFELNFEENAVIYDVTTSQQLREMFYQDLKYSDKINPEAWRERSHVKQFFEKLARLLSPLL